MGNNPVEFKSDKVGQDCRRFPIETVSWDDAQDFVRRLKAKEGGSRFRLATETEWNMLRKADIFKYSGSDNPETVAWYYDNSGGRTHKVGTKQPNGFELYDMSGNVWEWVQDRYDENAYRKLSSKDPVNSNSGFNRVHRGGSWNHNADNLRSANRYNFSLDYRIFNIGFRLLRTAE